MIEYELRNKIAAAFANKNTQTVKRSEQQNEMEGSNFELGLCF